MRSRQSLKALVLCALALGVMGISADAAQATPTWMIAGSNLAAPLEPLVGSEIENGTVSLLATINGLDLELLCETVILAFVRLVAGDKTNSTGDVHFNGCVAYQWHLNAEKKYTERLKTACEPHTLGKLPGAILTEPGYGLIELHMGGVPVVLIKPNNAEEKVANIIMGECAFPEEIPVFGLFFIKDCKNLAEKEEFKHLVEELKALTTLTVVNKKAENAAHIDGSAWLSLPGGHTNLKWSALAG